MGDRFSPRELVRAQWASMRRFDRKDAPPDRAARSVLILVPAMVFVAAVYFGWPLNSPEALLSGFSLLSAGLPTLFV